MKTEQISIEWYQDDMAREMQLRDAVQSIYGSGDKRLTSITNPQDVYKYLKEQVADLTVERFMILTMNDNSNITHIITITQGTLNASPVHSREVFRAAILHNASGLILAHNHPSCNPDPSPQDIEITKELVEAGKLIGIPVHEHIIFTADNYISFLNRGLI